MSAIGWKNTSVNGATNSIMFPPILTDTKSSVSSNSRSSPVTIQQSRTNRGLDVYNSERPLRDYSHCKQLHKYEMNLELKKSTTQSSSTTALEDHDELSPLPEKDFSSSLSNSPRCSPPTTSYLRQRSHTIDTSFRLGRNYKRTQSNPISIIPKDAVQPKMGSIGDIHGHQATHSEEDEEGDDFFSELPPMRSRSHTCPDSILHKRKVKVRSLRRPSTPPPLDIGCDRLRKLTISPKDIDREIDILVKFDAS